MTISITNSSGQGIDVAINQWGNKAQTTFFRIESGETESWDRSDGRGFVMVVTSVSQSREEGTYWFVRKDVNLTVNSLTSIDGTLASLPNPYKN